MDCNSEFIPDFTEASLAGVVATKNSKIAHMGERIYVSINNRVHVWNSKTIELQFTLGSRSEAVSSFCILDGMAVLGYESGVVEIIPDEADAASTVARLHKRRVSHIVACEGGFISASVDGTVSRYDTTLWQSRLSYVGSRVAVERIGLAGGLVCALCADKTLRIWGYDCPDLKDAHVFEDYLFGLACQRQSVLVIMRSGRSTVVDLGTRERRPFETFGKVRNAVQKNGRFAVQMQKKLVIFDDSEKCLVPVVRIASSDLLTAFDICGDQIAFLTKSNGLCVASLTDEMRLGAPSAQMLAPATSSITHASEIIQIEIVKDEIFSLSKERLIIWRKFIENEYEDLSGRVSNANIEEYSRHTLEVVGWIDMAKATCFCLFKDFIAIGTGNGLVLYKDREIFKSFAIGKVASIAQFNDVLAVAVDTVVTFYDDSFTIIHELVLPEPAIFSAFGPFGNIFCVSMLDNKINVYNFPSLDLKISLYGHSLPVRSFAISANGKSLLSCGADKLVKLWGLDFGECRKSFVGDAQNCAFIEEAGGTRAVPDDLFMFADKRINYYRRFVKLAAFKCLSPGLVKAGSDFLIVTADRGLALFTMNRYEFLEIDHQDAEQEHPMATTMATVDSYDRFLGFLERLETSPLSDVAGPFYSFLESLEYSEVQAMLTVLDRMGIHSILTVLEASLDRNAILNARIFKLLVACHTDACVTHGAFDTIHRSLISKLGQLRELCGGNEYKTLTNNKWIQDDVQI